MAGENRLCTEKGLKGEGEHKRVVGEGKRTLLRCLSHRDMTSGQEPEERHGEKQRVRQTGRAVGCIRVRHNDMTDVSEIMPIILHVN